MADHSNSFSGENERTDAYSGALGYNVKKIKEDGLMTSGINRRDFLKASARAGMLLSFGAGKGMGSLSTAPYDIVIRNGTVVDGHGAHSGELAGKLLYGPGKK
jgi:hypothetical protein